MREFLCAIAVTAVVMGFLWWLGAMLEPILYGMVR